MKLKRREMESIGLDRYAVGCRMDGDSYETISNKLRDVHGYRISPPSLGKIFKDCWGDPLERYAWSDKSDFGKKKVQKGNGKYSFTGEYDPRNGRDDTLVKSSRKWAPPS